jgi:hypothetical protein
LLEADPEAILRYNDYSLEDPAKRRKLIALIKSLQAQHVPVMAIGSQAHVNVSTGFETMDQARVAPAVPTICISIRQATGSWESDTGKECSHCSVFTSVMAFTTGPTAACPTIPARQLSATPTAP